MDRKEAMVYRDSDEIVEIKREVDKAADRELERIERAMMYSGLYNIDMQAAWELVEKEKRMDEVQVKRWESFKHNFVWNTMPGRFIRGCVTRAGMILMWAARRCFKWSLGRCSWCGGVTGMGEISGKGHRCDGPVRDCSKY